jgi:polysaccharide biosynthesis/export protein
MHCLRTRLISLALLLVFVGALQVAAQDTHPNPGVESAKPAEVKTDVFPSAEPEKTDPAADDKHTDSSLRLGAGDLLEIGVYNVPELTTKARISSAGDVYLPLVDYVHIAGLTPEEAQAVIEKRLSSGGFVKDPHVTVFVSQFASQGVSVLGEVAKPGVYPVYGQQRLFDLISAAGGLTDKAGRTVSVAHRNQPDKPTVVKLARNIADNPESNVELYPGDTVIVRRADIVYVVGDVGRPSGFQMADGRLTVLQAVALAGGANHTAKLNSVKILRKTPQGMTETPVQLKKILQAKATDVPLQADDILFVPTSASKVAGKRAVDAAVQMATAVTIFAVR